jgi:hypothetical protein
MESHLDVPAQPTRNDDERTVSSAALLDRWLAHDWRDSVSLDELSPFDRIVVTTKNHTYEIVVGSTDERTVLVRGGTAFPEFMSAHLIGSSLGGSAIKLRTVAVGSRLELTTHNGRWLITTPVQAIAVVLSGASHRDDAKAT